MQLQDILKTERAMWQKLGAACWVIQDFVLKHGRVCLAQPLPGRFKMRAQKNCYWNAQEIVNQSKGRYRYAEGYVISSRLAIPIMHGWAIDPECRVIDPTLRDGERAQYFGIVFEHAIYQRLRPRGGGPLLEGEYGFQISNWLLLDPGYQEVLDQVESKA